MLIAAVFVLTIISYNSNNSVCVCLKIHVSPSNDAAAVMAARGVPIMWQKNWLARGWRKARRPPLCMCVCASAVSNGAFECLFFFFVAPASKYGVVCVVRPPQLNIDVLIRRSCCLKPFALRGVLLIHTSTVTQPYTHARTEAHADRAQLLTSVSSFFSYVNNYWQAALFLVILCHCLIGQWQSGHDKAHLPHVHSSGC